jgi:hypothetical protein
MLKALLTFGVAAGLLVLSPTVFSWANSLTVPPGTPAPTHVAFGVQHTGGNPASAVPPAAATPASASCSAGTKPILIDNGAHCQVIHVGNAHCPSGAVLVHDGSTPPRCAKGTISATGEANLDRRHPAGLDQLPPPAIQFNANVDAQAATDSSQFDGSADMSASGDTQSQDAVESPQDPTQLGTPTCPDGYTLITMGGVPTCKGATHIACDSEGARHLMPSNAVNKRWDPRACHWNYQLAN